MPVFQLWDHPQMRLCQASVEPKRRDRDKFGWRPRYVVEIVDAEHADQVIDMLDDAMRPRTKGHGVYQCDYDELRAAYGALLADAPRAPTDVVHGLLRTGAFVLAVAVAVFTAVTLPLATLGFLVLSAIRRQPGMYAMFEYEVVRGIFDRRPLIKALLRYARNG